MIDKVSAGGAIVARCGAAFIHIYFTLCSREAWGTDAAVGRHAILTRGPVLTPVIQALVYVLLTRGTWII